MIHLQTNMYKITNRKERKKELNLVCIEAKKGVPVFSLFSRSLAAGETGDRSPTLRLETTRPLPRRIAKLVLVIVFMETFFPALFVRTNCNPNGAEPAKREESSQYEYKNQGVRKLRC